MTLVPWNHCKINVFISSLGNLNIAWASTLYVIKTNYILNKKKLPYDIDHNGSHCPLLLTTCPDVNQKSYLFIIKAVKPKTQFCI